jgi:hypothetical protein
VGRVGPAAAHPINERAAADEDVTARQVAHLAAKQCGPVSEACAREDQVDDDDTNDDSK